MGNIITVQAWVSSCWQEPRVRSVFLSPGFAPWQCLGLLAQLLITGYIRTYLLDICASWWERYADCRFRRMSCNSLQFFQMVGGIEGTEFLEQGHALGSTRACSWMLKAPPRWQSVESHYFLPLFFVLFPLWYQQVVKQLTPHCRPWWERQLPVNTGLRVLVEILLV